MAVESAENRELRRALERTVSGMKIKAFPAADWEICGMYAVFAFRKGGESLCGAEKGFCGGECREGVMVVEESDIKFF